ncbi:hypothetical protein DPMN_168197 [Dreissena polymorpha]|uniref:Uncharacterized protein n=1 Tax=Dreissena polymorpha TaxID=45954 RepID=A0A9D4F286_DREPO|nr:hypothetical protein DPMN_168197 [Dreissena polymorpha]
MFNIGVLEENPLTISGVVNMLDHLHNYVPTDGEKRTHYCHLGRWVIVRAPCRRQNIRANAETPRDHLEGLEQAAQEFHKRIILLQASMTKKLL